MFLFNTVKQGIIFAAPGFLGIVISTCLHIGPVATVKKVNYKEDYKYVRVEDGYLKSRHNL